MSNKGFLIVSFLCVITGVLGWYFFIKKYDYQVFFVVKAVPGSVYTRIKEMSQWDLRSKQTKISLRQTIPGKLITQNLEYSSNVATLEWHFHALGDSATHVEVGVIGDQDSFRNRLKVLFRIKKFENEFISGVDQLRKDLEGYLKTFKVDLEGRSRTPALFYAYLRLKSRVNDKAGKMMASVEQLSSYLHENKIRRAGDPFVKVREWNREKDSIYFDFCFPVKMNESLPENELIKYDSIASMSALKAIYYGNYATSNEAWMKLHQFAQYNNIMAKPMPLEIFLNNPHNGGNDREWKAEVYLPIL